MTHLGLRDWEWMLRTAAPEPTDAEQWLNDRVRYDRSGERPIDWRGQAYADLPNIAGEAQDRETNRSIDDDHEAFQRALNRGTNAHILDEGQFSLTGPRPQQYEPTSPERLASDEGWILGPGKQFNYPGGRESIETIHNGMHQRGFELENAGTDENPIPAYVHQQSGARISPLIHSLDTAGWQMTGPRGGVSEHSNPASAAAHHQQSVAEQSAAEALRWQSAQDRNNEGYYDQNPSSAPRGTGISTRRREAPDYIPKTKAQRMSWGNLFDEAIHGNDGHGREFERASVSSVHNPYSGSTGRLYGVHQDQWNKDFENDRQGRGKVAQAIYHYATPIAWKYHEVQPDGTYDEGTWRQPATSFGSAGFFSTGRVQSLMGPSLWRTNHQTLRDPLVPIRAHRAMEESGIRRQPDQSYRVIDAHGNEHNLAPSQTGKTVVHTVKSPEGRTFTKRLPTGEAAENAYRMTQSPGAGGPSDPVEYLRSNNYRDSQPPPPTRRRRDVPLRIQPELPFRNSSVAAWSDFLRFDG